jgi:hypothetical protein
MRLMSRPPDSTLVPTTEGFDSRHHVFQLGGQRVAMKYYHRGDAVFNPNFARSEAQNLTYLRKGLFVPAVRPLRDDMSMRFDPKSGLWVPSHQWGRLFTDMPEGYHSINRLDFNRMGKEDRAKLMAELGFAMGFLHRRRAVHGDPTLANLLIKQPGWVHSPHSLENIKHLDVESLYPAGEMPSEEEIRQGFARDVQVLAEDARRLGLVREGEGKEMLEKHFWNSYMSHWRGRGEEPSRLERTIEKMGPGIFFRRMHRDEASEEEKKARLMSERIEEKLGLNRADDPHIVKPAKRKNVGGWTYKGEE